MANECSELGVLLWQHTLDLTLVDLLNTESNHTDLVDSLRWWLLDENDFQFACAATELWAREVRYSSKTSLVARALQARDHDDCMECLARGACTHACCRATWERIGLRNHYVKKDGQGDLILSEPTSGEPSAQDDPVDVASKEEVPFIIFTKKQGQLMTSMSDTDACEEFMTNLDVENGDLDIPPGVEFYVHYQSLTSVSNLEYVNMLQPFGRGKWDATRDTGGGTSLYCYAYEAFEDDKTIPLPDDCHTVVIHTNAIPNELLVESEDE